MVSEGFVPFLNKMYTERDVLIACDKDNLRRWCLRGGAGFLWEEIDWRADVELVSKLLIERFKALEKYVNQVQHVSP